jgi:hypothetical protein
MDATFLFSSAFLQIALILYCGFLFPLDDYLLLVVVLFYFPAIRPIRNAQNPVSTNAGAIVRWATK